MENLDLDARARILKAAMELLEKEKDTSKITVRQIAEMAGVGTGLINYHFKSKDKLLNDAVGVTMEAMAEGLKAMNSNDIGTPLDKLKLMLRQLSDFGLKYQKLTKISITYEIQHGDLQVPMYIVPVLREIYGGKKDERELRMLAFALVTSLQVIYMRADAFYRYSGIDIMDEKQRNEAIDKLIDNLIKK